MTICMQGHFFRYCCESSSVLFRSDQPGHGLALETVSLLLLQSKSTVFAMDSKQFASTVAQFSARFCNELEKGSSVVSSPMSAEFVLALLALGATDKGHDEILTSLGIPDDEAIRSSFTTVSGKLKAIKGVTFNVANRVYLMDGPYELNSHLEEDAIKVFDAGIEKIDFSTGGAATNAINKWVEGKTNNKIKDLLSPDSVDGNTRLVLVNALYFKGSWTKKFDPNFTTDQPFYINSQTTVNVPMMFREDKYKYGDSSELQAQLLEMSYEGEEASMVIILPNEIDGLDGVLQKLADGFNLIAELEKMHSMKVQVSVPKFKIETEIDLKDLLPKLGIKAIFDEADSGLNKLLKQNEPLFVSKAVQKAFIEVNEEGAEAAAATGMVVMMRCMPMPASTFRADRPFLYLLNTDRHTLFVGAYRGRC